MHVQCAWVVYYRYGCNGPSLYIDSPEIPALWFEIDLDEIPHTPKAGTGTAIRGRFGSRGQMLFAQFNGTSLEVYSEESPLSLQVNLHHLEDPAPGLRFDIPITKPSTQEYPPVRVSGL
jgi:hypothetical protein